jgi:transcriptional regulator with XRE-family HTH domain
MQKRRAGYGVETEKRLTQDELSELAGMNGKHLGEVERGMINVTIQNLDKIAESLGVTLLELLDMEHLKPKDELCREIARLLDEAGYEQVRTFIGSFTT